MTRQSPPRRRGSSRSEPKRGLTVNCYTTRVNRSSVVHSDPDILSGTPVFVGTGVPVQALIDYAQGGAS